jgi:hypothetical protein
VGLLGWIAVLAAVAMALGYYQTRKELIAGYSAIAATQQEMAKLGYLWALEIKKRRSL